MFQTKVICILVIAASLTEFSLSQREGNENGLKKADVSQVKVREEMLAAVRRGDIRGFRRGINKGGMKEFIHLFRNYSEPKLEEIEVAMNDKMHAIEMLISSNLAVPASEDQSEQYHFNVTVVPGLPAVTKLSLNLDALKNWTFYEKPLHTLCNLPDVEPRIVKYLLDKGLDIHERSEFLEHQTLLDLAASNGNLALVKFLIEKGADPKELIRSDIIESALYHYYSFIKVISPEDFAIRNRKTIHHNALVSAIYRGNKDIIHYLIALGVDVNVNNQSWLALFYPVSEGKTELVEILLKNGIDVNARGQKGATALHIAADRGKPEMAKLLLNNGAKVTAIDKFGWTPLHVAAFSSQNISLVELLIKSGASIEAKTDGGFTPLILAVAGSTPSFLDCLKEATASHFSKNISCPLESNTEKLQNKLEIISLLCKKESNVDHKDEVLGWSALHWARASGNGNAGKLLVDKCGASNAVMSKAGLSPDDVAKHFGKTSHQ